MSEHDNFRDKIRWREQEEKRARRRKIPPWNPDTESPWRSLEDILITVLKTYEHLKTHEDITIFDLITILERNKVWFVGTRGDKPYDLPDRIETLVTAAETREFYFLEANSILTSYSEPLDRVALFGPKSLLEIKLPFNSPQYRPLVIMFENVRGHYPMVVEALREAGFEPRRSSSRAGTKTRQKRLRKASPQEIDEAITAAYDERKDAGDRPYNILEIVAPVQVWLGKKYGATASGRQIQKLAKADKHKVRRLPVGQQVNSKNLSAKTHNKTIA
jgi:hypothetical protein